MCVRFAPEEFCNLCASYITIKNRREITDKVKDMFNDIYGYEINLEEYAPSSICQSCLNSFKKFISGTYDNLKIVTPAKWGDFRCDHRDCFYHLVKVDLETNTTELPKVATFLPPIFFKDIT